MLYSSISVNPQRVVLFLAISEIFVSIIYLKKWFILSINFSKSDLFYSKYLVLRYILLSFSILPNNINKLFIFSYLSECSCNYYSDSIFAVSQTFYRFSRVFFILSLAWNNSFILFYSFILASHSAPLAFVLDNFLTAISISSL